MSTGTTVYRYEFYRKGLVVKIQPEGHRYRATCSKDDLGLYDSAEKATQSLSENIERMLSDGTYLADLEIPGDLAEWEWKVFLYVKRLRAA